MNGKQLKEKGIEKSLETANKVHEKWSEKAFKFLKDYATRNKFFMTEQVRLASEGKIPNPPSNRAWGGIIKKASKSGIIEHIGYGKVSNTKAHQANASIWQSSIVC